MGVPDNISKMKIIKKNYLYEKEFFGSFTQIETKL